MSESKTPMTDDLHRNQGVLPYTKMWKLSEQLEAENAELKDNAKLWEAQVHEAIRQVAASDSLFRKTSAENAELKRQLEEAGVCYKTS